MIRHCLGDDTRRIILLFPVDKHGDWDDPITEYCIGNSNEVLERFQFFRRQRPDMKSIGDFVIALKTLANSCNFCQYMKDSLIQDMIVTSVRNESNTKALDLRTCINICKSEGATRNQLQHLMEYTTTNELNALPQSIRITCNFCGLIYEKHKENCLAWFPLRKTESFCLKVSFQFPEVDHANRRSTCHYQRFPAPWLEKRPIRQHPG
ncbi:hypothetical protein FBUS_03738 [Fasciolopsis buskii]|uniref:Uncharacterized protein n=1 Tax=Fasciolopsis buskii TaxID=27845 RepID=A0A8E0RLQ0_9TREM|nr:hypothetical protein FBUS_03738 [Fasciolopsis buski]